MAVAISAVEYLKKAEQVHNSDVKKYDYKDTVFGKSRDNIRVFCISCNEYFTINQKHHINCGKGCQKCSSISKSKKLMKTTEGFINDAKIKYSNNEYDYSMVDYRGAEKVVTIKCNTCGSVFDQLPFVHLNDSGCPTCARKKQGDFNRHYTEDFINKSKLLNPDFEMYDYSKSEYKNANSRVTVICKVCGEEFHPVANKHAIGKSGCPNKKSHPKIS